ncbi:MAG TPA: DUF3060 domain-containing protein [Acetobacteraceae bacterium]|nr:DUF3060 domain-containing protein [Acetobacteraceae bacterium]
MRSAVSLLLLAAVAAGATGCSFEMAATPAMRNGWMVYTGDATTVQGACGVLPIQLDGSHTSTLLAGHCRQVTVTGNHNDVTLGLEPGARVEVTGTHNDIWWYPLRTGPLPRLIDRGSDNAFHLT